MYYFKTWKRLLKLTKNNRFLLIIYIFQFLPYPFQIKVESQKNIQHYSTKRSSNEPVGFSETPKIVTIKFFSLGMHQYSISDEYVLNLLTFYIFRQPQTIEHVLDIYNSIGQPIQLKAHDRVFDAGCNAGRLLFHMVDKYGVTGYGADIYAPAIQIAQLANYDNKAKVECVDLVDSNYLDQFHDHYFKLLIWSSHLSHVSHLSQFNKYLASGRRIAQHIAIIDKDSEQLRDNLTKQNIAFQVEGKKLYGYI